VAYAQTSGDWRWFASNLPVIEDVAARNLIQNRNANGLTYTFQDPSEPRVAYLEDNSEVYAAFVDLADYLASTGDTAGARTYRTQAAKTLRGIKTLFNPSDSTWWTADPHPPLGTTCYPDAVSQIFPEAHGVPVPGRWRAAGYKYLNLSDRHWPTSLCGGFPWAMLGYVAVVRHDTRRAQAKLAHIQQIAADLTPEHRAQLAIHELGWYRRTQEALGAQAP
jgi:hypothetical protein